MKKEVEKLRGFRWGKRRGEPGWQPRAQASQSLGELHGEEGQLT